MADRRGYTIVGGPEFAALAAALRDIDETAVERFREAMREEAQPILTAVRQAALSLPAHGVKHSGLRARVAAGTDVRVSFAGRPSLRFTTSMDDPQEAELPRGLDNGPAGWRHPVYGNRNAWVQQHGSSWFRDTIADRGGDIQDRLEEALEDMARRVGEAGQL
ncbi:hypothetical protein [Streptomyces sp. NPDC055085]